MKSLPANHLLLAIGLAAIAGTVDVIAFLSLGGFFASFMSGNTTRLAVGIAGNVADATLAFSLVLGFLAGVVGGTLARRAARGNAIPATLSLVTLLLTLCAIIARPYQASPLIMLAGAMGAVNTVFARPQGEVDNTNVPLTYMTGTIVRFGQALTGWLTREGSAADCLAPLLLWLGFVGGGLIGAGLYARVGLLGLWAPAAVCGLLSVWLWWCARASAAEPEANGHESPHNPRP